MILRYEARFTLGFNRQCGIFFDGGMISSFFFSDFCRTLQRGRFMGWHKLLRSQSKRPHSRSADCCSGYLNGHIMGIHLYICNSTYAYITLHMHIQLYIDILNIYNSTYIYITLYIYTCYILYHINLCMYI